MIATAPVPAQDQSDILTRVIVPESGHLSRQAAEAILEWKFPPADIDRINQLAEMNRLGTATPAEFAELESYLHVGSLLNLLHLKAERSLKNG